MTCRNTSQISAGVTPLVSAPRMWAFNSCGRLRALIIARLSMLRCLRSSPGRPHILPQQYSVTNVCSGALKLLRFASARFTYSSPSTALRIFKPSWYGSSDTGTLLRIAGSRPYVPRGITPLLGGDDGPTPQLDCPARDQPGIQGGLCRNRSISSRSDPATTAWLPRPTWPSPEEPSRSSSAMPGSAVEWLPVS